MSLFNISIETFMIRFYLMMIVVIGAFFIGMPFLAILALPILLSNMLGIRFNLKALQFTVTTHPTTNIQSSVTH